MKLLLSLILVLIFLPAFAKEDWGQFYSKYPTLNAACQPLFEEIADEEIRQKSTELCVDAITKCKIPFLRTQEDCITEMIQWGLLFRAGYMSPKEAAKLCVSTMKEKLNKR